MFVFKALDTNYHVPESLAEIKLGVFIEFIEQVRPQMPEALEDVLSTALPKNRRKKLDKLSMLTYSREFIPYFALYVAHFTDIPYDLMMGQGEWKSETDGMNRNDLEKLFWHIFNLFGKMDEYEKRGYIQEHEFLGGTWCFPSELMKGDTVIEFLESTQFQHEVAELAGGKWRALANVLAVIFRPKGEAYNYKIFEERAELFKREMNCDLAFYGAFFLSRSNRKYLTDLAIYTVAQRLGKLKRESKNLAKGLERT